MKSAERQPRTRLGQAAALIALLWQPSYGGTYFISPQGNDAAQGSAEAPWQTLQHAANLVLPGDVVFVRPGQYAGFDLQRSGRSDSPIRFSAEPGAQIVQPNGRTADGINLENASYVVIEGFEVIGMPRAGLRIVGSAEAPSRSVIARRNVADSNGVWGIFSGYAEDILLESNITSRSQREHGIYVSNSADRPIIRNNVSWGNAAGGIQINADGTLPGDGVIREALVAGNIAYENGTRGGAAINLDGVQASRIENNLLYGNHATGIALFQGDGAAGSSHNVIANNTVVNAADGRWALTLVNESSHNTVVNNILYSAHGFRGGLDVDTSSLLGLVSDFNATEDRFGQNGGDQVFSLAEWQAATGQDLHSRIGTPSSWFEAVSLGNYQLSATSTARDSGTSQSAPTHDLLGVPRPICGLWDAGAFEYTRRGDLNFDCSVDAFDAGVMFASWGGMGPADLNHDTTIDAADAGELFAAWTGDIQPRAVPEPSAVWLAAFLVGSYSARLACIR